MRKIFLTSVFANVADDLRQLLSEAADKLTVAFVPTAADVYEDRWFVEKDRKKLVEMGFKIIDLPLKNQTKGEISKVLKKVQIIFVAGGNTFYLLKQARLSGFTELIPGLVDKGIVYIGSSAGSYLACPTIEVATWKYQDRNIVRIRDFTALNLVPFLISVHYKPEYMEILKENIPKSKYLVKILTDEQAILVQGEKVRLVGRGNEVKMV